MSIQFKRKSQRTGLLLSVCLKDQYFEKMKKETNPLTPFPLKEGGTEKGGDRCPQRLSRARREYHTSCLIERRMFGTALGWFALHREIFEAGFWGAY